jgi:hypothetical protein
VREPSDCDADPGTFFSGIAHLIRRDRDLVIPIVAVASGSHQCKLTIRPPRLILPDIATRRRSWLPSTSSAGAGRQCGLVIGDDLLIDRALHSVDNSKV